MRYAIIAWSALIGLALVGSAQADDRDSGEIPVDQIVDLMIDQAGTLCTSASSAGPWGFAVAPVDTIGVRFTIPQGEVFVLTDVEWAYSNIDPENPPVLSLGSDFSSHFWTPFLQLSGSGLIGTTLAGSAHFRTGIVVTSQNTTSAFCVVGNTKPAGFNAQGFFTEEEVPRPTGH
jgi:hypothetical protein